MKRILLAALAATMLGAPVFGQAATTPPGAMTQTQADRDSLTIEQALTVASGLGQLSKYDTVDKDGKPATQYYDFSPDVRMLIALNIDLGRRLQSQYQAANNDLVMAWTDTATGQVPDAKKNAFTIEQAKLLAAPSRVGYYHIRLSDLKLDKNPIPGPVLSMIVSIIDR